MQKLRGTSLKIFEDAALNGKHLETTKCMSSFISGVSKLMAERGKQFQWNLEKIFNIWIIYSQVK